jgi:hypothetical protein
MGPLHSADGTDDQIWRRIIIVCYWPAIWKDSAIMSAQLPYAF